VAAGFLGAPNSEASFDFRFHPHGFVLLLPIDPSV